MPGRSLRPCAQQPCPELVEKGRCTAHTRAREHRREAGRPDRDKFYDTARWRRFRKLFLARHPLCEMNGEPQDCVRRGLTTAATDVDHVVPISEGGLPLDVENCRAACHACHSRRTARDTWRRPARVPEPAAEWFDEPPAGEGGLDLYDPKASDRRLRTAHTRTELGVSQITTDGGS
jgi:5-methylcytosine-specific restriction enzyme A